VLYTYIILGAMERTFKYDGKFISRIYYPMCYFGKKDPNTGEIFYEIIALILYTRCNAPRCDCVTYSVEKDECFWTSNAENNYLK